MIAHLRKWIGLYLIGLLSLAIIFDDPNDDYGIGVWIFAIILVVFITPPFSLKDRIAGLIFDFYEWLFQIPLGWLQRAPRWIQIVFVVSMVILFEELIFKPLGYTMYPWRYDWGF